MSEKKTISINPELFSMSGRNSTRKKREPSHEKKDLKIKSSSPKQPYSTKTLRNRLLHYIRKNQEDNFKKMHGSKPEIEVPDKKYNSHIIDEKFNNDFEESLKYMTKMADEVKNKVDNNYMINQTLRNYKSLNPESILCGKDFEKSVEGVGISEDSNVYQIVHNAIDNVNPVKLSPPKWGCMKGGSLPTYRLWKNQTQKHRESEVQSPSIDLGNMSMSSIGSVGGKNYNPMDTNRVETMDKNIIKGEPMTKRNEFDGPRLSQLKQTMEKVKMQKEKEANEKNKITYGKRKKTIRRTYKLGKSRNKHNVSVLVSNKTVRKNISTKTEKLKQIPMEEIRAVLIKKGFIKVGSLATNDVLRKMYESMLLVCGEVENHNPENMLYNYFNA